MDYNLCLNVLWTMRFFFPSFIVVCNISNYFLKKIILNYLFFAKWFGEYYWNAGRTGGSGKVDASGHGVYPIASLTTSGMRNFSGFSYILHGQSSGFLAWPAVHMMPNSDWFVLSNSENLNTQNIKGAHGNTSPLKINFWPEVDFSTFTQKQVDFSTSTPEIDFWSDKFVW